MEGTVPPSLKSWIRLCGRGWGGGGGGGVGDRPKGEWGRETNYPVISAFNLKRVHAIHEYRYTPCYLPNHSLSEGTT